jgi:hypothetical protein
VALLGRNGRGVLLHRPGSGFMPAFSLGLARSGICGACFMAGHHFARDKSSAGLESNEHSTNTEGSCLVLLWGCSTNKPSTSLVSEPSSSNHGSTQDSQHVQTSNAHLASQTCENSEGRFEKEP